MSNSGVKFPHGTTARQFPHGTTARPVTTIREAEEIMEKHRRKKVACCICGVELKTYFSDKGKAYCGGCYKHSDKYKEIMNWWGIW